MNPNLLLVDAAIKPLNQLPNPYGKCVAYAEKSSDRNGPTGLYLLPMAS